MTTTSCPGRWNQCVRPQVLKNLQHIPFWNVTDTIPSSSLVGSRNVMAIGLGVALMSGARFPSCTGSPPTATTYLFNAQKGRITHETWNHDRRLAAGSTTITPHTQHTFQSEAIQIAAPAPEAARSPSLTPNHRERRGALRAARKKCGRLVSLSRSR